MAAKRQTRKARGGSQPRVSVTFPPELYATLVELARKRKVSVAWIVRDAAEHYVAAQPTFVGQTGGSAKL